jgi:hypothetical protein
MHLFIITVTKLGNPMAHLFSLLSTVREVGSIFTIHTFYARVNKNLSHEPFLMSIRGEYLEHMHDLTRAHETRQDKSISRIRSDHVS